ncbi:PREDICTED: carbon catabolite repressor protein 4 homolog 3 isoform X1 [Nelumbo nucifera]|uniref:Carbon catabolite repressor protein 4 homolog 3 isoform X1 n=1 Tax=Nelumbo nucifera TaxID=4432 RepID=A0A1U8AE44_NELNU|nr:PREDICTED: carbon catabolite repressor protein 4 homolog 3 isoform X1 [Nelumbo nucifera]
MLGGSSLLRLWPQGFIVRSNASGSLNPTSLAASTMAPMQPRTKSVVGTTPTDRNESISRRSFVTGLKLIIRLYSTLKWERRKRLICQELIGWKPDIICLQEVDRYYDLLSIMEKNGYAGSYKRRTGHATDGCALFWRATTFRLLEGESIEFRMFGLRDNVAQLSVFEMCRADSRRVLVGNIHVLFNPSRGDIKLGQIRLLLQRAHALSEKWGNIPVVLVGDFNSTPQSAVYKFLSSSELNVTLYDRRYLSGQIPMRRPFVLIDGCLNYSWSGEQVNIATGSPNRTIVEHPLKLNSSYLTVKGSARTRGSHGEPLATTYHSRFLGTVDYLWYSDGLFPTRVLDTPPVDMLRKTGGLPSKKLGSDHLALVSEFAFKKAEGKLKPTPYQDPHQTYPFSN